VLDKGIAQSKKRKRKFCHHVLPLMLFQKPAFLSSAELKVSTAGK